MREIDPGVWGRLSRTPRRVRRAPLMAVLVVLAAATTPATAAADTAPVTTYAAYGSVKLGDASIDATGSGATAGAAKITLPPGYVYRVRTCLAVHVLGSPPQANCSEKLVDATGWTEATAVSAPTETRTLPAGTSAPAWGTFRVDVLYATGLSFTGFASTLPDGSGIPQPLGLNDAGRATPQPTQGVPVSVPPGGLNDFGQASFCVPTDYGPTTGTPSGVRANTLGSDAPAYSETGEPTVAGSPRGVVLVLHSSGWSAVGARSAQSARPEADRWRARGWRSVNADYRGCGEAPGDAQWFVRRIKERFPTLPLCVLGQSAGGHLAVLAAAKLPNLVACVVAEGAPIDLAAFADQTVADGRGGQSADGGKQGYNLAVSAFGAENLAAFTPDAGAMTMPTLLANSTGDTLIPTVQGTNFRDAILARHPGAPVTALQLQPGPREFPHGGVSAASFNAFVAREAALAAAVGLKGSAAPGTTPMLTVSAGPSKQGVVTVRVRVRRSGRVTLSLRLTSASAKRLHRPTAVVRTTKAIRPGRTVIVRLTLPRAVRKALARSGRSAAATLVATRGSARETVRVTLRPR